MTRSSFLLIFFFTISCNFPDPVPATEDQKKTVLTNAQYDYAAIAELARYLPLKDFLEKYSDTIISYRDSKNYVIEVGNANKTDTVLKKEDCYYFTQGSPNSDISHVPDFLRARLDSLYKMIGDSNIRSFDICRNKKITIDIKVENKEAGLSLFHCLLWHSKIETDYAYIGNKDSLINQDCIYRIGMTESHGW